MNKIVLLSAAALFLSVSPVSAEEAAAGSGAGHHHGHQMFEKQDINSDGLISKDEFMQMHEKRFHEVDADGDGNISKEEAKTYGEAKRKQMKERHEKMKEHGKDMKDSPDADHSGDE